jgi:hypothetical protein
MAANTKIDICSDALVLCGIGPISSFEDGSTPANAAAQLYERAIKNNLTLERWRFASRQVPLQRSTEKPAARWSAIYPLPPELLDLHTVTMNDVPIEYDRYEEGVYCDLGESDRPVADFTFRAVEPVWPPYFVTLVTFDLAMYFAGSVARNGELAAAWEKKWNDQLVAAKLANAQAQTARRPKKPSRILTQR